MAKPVIKILFVGDIIGRYGRRLTKTVLPQLLVEEPVDFILANGENAAAGYGISEKVYQELMAAGIDIFTMGNHIWDRKEAVPKIDTFENLVRPANYPDEAPGKTFIIKEKKGIKLGVFNLCGRVFMPALDCPFKKADALINEIKKQTSLILIDMHAEATSEKQALAFYVDGRVSAVLGTHTHIQTADEHLLPGGTAFITDLGMVGAENSVIGMNKEQILRRFLTQMPHKFDVEKKGPGVFNAARLEIDCASGKALSIKRIFRRLAEDEIKDTPEKEKIKCSGPRPKLQHF